MRKRGPGLAARRLKKAQVVAGDAVPTEDDDIMMSRSGPRSSGVAVSIASRRGFAFQELGWPPPAAAPVRRRQSDHRRARGR